MTGTVSPRPDYTSTVESLWRNRNFLLLWVGQGSGALGPQVALIVLPLLALNTLSATAFEVSLITFLGWLPYLLFSLPAGVVADWFDQRRVMIACDVLRAALMLSVPLVAVAGNLTLTYLYVVLFVSGVLTVLFTVAYRSQLPRLVHSTQLVDGNGKLGVSERLAELAGPALGGALVGLVGTGRALYANVLTFVISAVTLVLMRVPRSAPEPGTRVPFRAAMTEGLSFVRRDVILRALLICTSVSNFFVVGTIAIQVTFMARDLHASPAAIGLVFTLG
ncbi:MAG: MFS transporter, partial [Micromonosporaceae bacterium]